MEDWNELSKDEKVENIRSFIGGKPPSGGWPDVRSAVHGMGRVLYEREKEQERRVREAEEAYEESKRERVHFYMCPKCDLDTGEWEGGFADGEFVKDDPPVFVFGVKEWQGQVSENVTCQECGFDATESRFISAWEDEHGDRPRPPEPDTIPHPEPTAERLHRDRMDAARSKRRQRNNGGR